MTIADRIRSIDFYKDLPKDLQEPSISGASGILCINNPFSIYGSYGSHGLDVYLSDLSVYAVLENLRSGSRC
jgi:hypothetical protein